MESSAQQLLEPCDVWASVQPEKRGDFIIESLGDNHDTAEKIFHELSKNDPDLTAIGQLISDVTDKYLIEVTNFKNGAAV